jgi:hypothetical protein
MDTAPAGPRFAAAGRRAGTAIVPARCCSSSKSPRSRRPFFAGFAPRRGLPVRTSSRPAGRRAPLDESAGCARDCGASARRRRARTPRRRAGPRQTSWCTRTPTRVRSPGSCAVCRRRRRGRQALRTGASTPTRVLERAADGLPARRPSALDERCRSSSSHSIRTTPRCRRPRSSEHGDPGGARRSGTGPGGDCGASVRSSAKRRSWPCCAGGQPDDRARYRPPSLTLAVLAGAPRSSSCGPWRPPPRPGRTQPRSAVRTCRRRAGRALFELFLPWPRRRRLLGLSPAGSPPWSRPLLVLRVTQGPVQQRRCC